LAGSVHCEASSAIVCSVLASDSFVVVDLPSSLGGDLAPVLGLGRPIGMEADLFLGLVRLGLMSSLRPLVAILLG